MVLALDGMAACRQGFLPPAAPACFTTPAQGCGKLFESPSLDRPHGWGGLFLWGILLEAGRRAQLQHPDKTDNKQLAGRFGAIRRNAKSMNVWMSFDCLEAIVWAVTVVLGWNETDRIPGDPSHVVFVLLCIVGPAIMMFVVKRVFAVVKYTQGDKICQHGCAAPRHASAGQRRVPLARLIHTERSSCRGQSLFGRTGQACGTRRETRPGAQDSHRRRQLLGNPVQLCRCSRYWLFAPIVNCSKLSGEPLCGYRTWEGLCRTWLVAPLSTTAVDLIQEMSTYMVFFLVLSSGLASLATNSLRVGQTMINKSRSNRHLQTAPPARPVAGARRLAWPRCRWRSHLPCLFYVCLTLLQLPMLMLGLPPANPGMMASEMYVPYLGTFLSVARRRYSTATN